MQPGNPQSQSSSLALWRLDTTQATLLLAENHQGLPRLIWFGERLIDQIDPTAIHHCIDEPNPLAKLDDAVTLSIFPDAASGFTGQAALQAHRQGQQFSPRFKCRSVTLDGQSLTVVGEDALAELEINISYTLESSSSVLSVQTSLVNRGQTIQIEWLASSTLPLDDQVSECLSLHGRWGAEFQQQRVTIPFGRIQFENNRGRTSHESFPGCVIGRKNFSEQDGEVLGVHLGWSGNHRVVIERLSNGSAYVQTGVLLQPGECSLENNGSITTPVTFATFGTGLNRLSHRFHEFVRGAILPAWTRTTRPVHANSWEALYFDHDQDKLLNLVDAAKSIGAERFVLDDGWFRGRRDDTAGLGDWTIDTDIYPSGLDALVRRVRHHKMQFGLWFEPEMVNPNSELYRSHPEWTLHVEGYQTPLARNQLVLNLGIHAVRQYLIDCISRLVEQYDIDYIKWDMNRDLVLAGDGQRSVAANQPHYCYQILNQLSAKYPSLEIESCSSGGARADYGILQHTGRIWTSDNIDPIERLNIHRGFSIFFPPEIMGSHVGHDVAHLTGRATSLDTRAVVALQGQYGFELDARNLKNAERESLAHYTEIYKSNRHWISQSKTWKCPTRTPALFISGLVSENREHSLWTVCAAERLVETSPEKFKPLGLDPGKLYRVRLVSRNAETLATFSKHVPAWIHQSVTLAGSVLMNIGLTMPVLPAQSSLLLDCSTPTDSTGEVT